MRTIEELKAARDAALKKGETWTLSVHEALAMRHANQHIAGGKINNVKPHVMKMQFKLWLMEAMSYLFALTEKERGGKE